MNPGNRSANQAEKIYQNEGNRALVDLMERRAASVLDVGCGAGDNAALILVRNPTARVFGVTRSAGEAEIAKKRMQGCFVFDIEGVFPPRLQKRKFDVLLFSHVLEHMREPAETVARFLPLLNKGGQILIAVPNVLHYRQRFKFLAGDFEYQASGTMDDTHLRFFTYVTADRYLLPRNSKLTLLGKTATGSFPLWLLRRYFLPKAWSRAADRCACALNPNLFGDQILLNVRYVGV